MWFDHANSFKKYTQVNEFLGEGYVSFLLLIDLV